MAEATLLSFLAPSARPLAPQVTALPPLAAYHDLRWLFAFNQSWLGFTGVLVLLVVARSAVDAVLVMLAWPRAAPESAHSPPRPRFLASLLSCAVLTVLVGLVMSPVVTLMFGVALLPFSWPYLAAVPILLGTAVALSQGGVGQAWWRRLPPARTAAWVIATFGVLSLSSALMARLDTPGVVAVAGLAGVVDARAWYGLTAAAVRAAAERPPHPWQWRAALWRIRLALRHRTSWVPMAPLAAVMVLALVVGHGPAGLHRHRPVRLGVRRRGGRRGHRGRPDRRRAAEPAPASAKAVTGPARVSGAVLVVEGFGSTCCHSANSLRAAEPHMLVRQFSYQGLDAAGQPIPYHLAGNMSIQVLGDRMAVQVEKLYRLAGTPVDIVAESEGTLGLYAMLARHPHLPVRSVVLLSPIVQPGQLGQAGGTVPGAALTTLNNLVGGMSPYGSSGAQELIDSVSEVGGQLLRRGQPRPRPVLAGGRAARRRGHAARLPDAAERDLRRRLPRRPARRPLGAADRGRVPGRRHTLGPGPGRDGGRIPAGPAQRGFAHRGRGRRLADAGPAPGLPQLLSTRPVAGPGCRPLRYAP